MGLTSLFIVILKPLLWLLPLLMLIVAIVILKSPGFKGARGERRVKRLIERRLNPAIYREFSNVTGNLAGIPASELGPF
jgi:hypothetical protein